jgi:hypothetical protein
MFDTYEHPWQKPFEFPPAWSRLQAQRAIPLPVNQPPRGASAACALVRGEERGAVSARERHRVQFRRALSRCRRDSLSLFVSQTCGQHCPAVTRRNAIDAGRQYRVEELTPGGVHAGGQCGQPRLQRLTGHRLDPHGQQPLGSTRRGGQLPAGMSVPPRRERVWREPGISSFYPHSGSWPAFRDVAVPRLRRSAPCRAVLGRYVQRRCVLRADRHG